MGQITRASHDFLGSPDRGGHDFLGMLIGGHYFLEFAQFKNLTSAMQILQIKYVCKIFKFSAPRAIYS